MYRLYLLTALLVSLIASEALSQMQAIGYFGLEKKVVKLDPLSDIPEGDFPFDRFFYIRRYIPNGILPIKAVYITEPIKSLSKYGKNLGLPPVQTIKEIDFWIVNSDIVKDQPGYAKMVDILVPPLKPRKSYDLIFDYPMSFARREQLAEALIAYHNGDIVAARKTLNNINAEKQRIKDSNHIDTLDFDSYYRQNARSLLATAGVTSGGAVSSSLRSTLIESLDDGGEPVMTTSGVASLLFLDSETLSMTGTESFKLETRAEAVVQPDFGAVFYGFGGKDDVGFNKNFMGVMPYVGFSVMFRSFDPNIPMRFIKPLHSWQRLSVQAGITLLSLAKDNYRENLFGGQNVMLGMGYRLSSAAKVQGGLIFYKKRTDPSPLNTDTMTATIGYVGLSLDLRIRNILGDIGKVFTAK